ncbi:MAG: EF hand [Rhodobacteraceae bacterium HLUCCO07]|nr:MAG: EF hand [Rhodobacteraceae bacterium HLUCCO07]
MKMRTTLSGAALALITFGGAAAADSNHGHGGPGTGSPGVGNNDMMQMMMPMHSGMMGDGMGMMQGGMPGMGSMGGAGGMMGGGLMPMMEALDADGDGTVTPEEAREGLQALLAEYDADGDESLSLAEFETLHSALIRETMVDRFQFLDDDGDGQVTVGEIVKPAKRMERMQSMRERMMQDDGNMPGAGPMGERGHGMMDDN